MSLSTMKNSSLFNFRNLGQIRWISKDIRIGSETRLGMLQGCNKLADAVSVTLGPKGRNVVIGTAYGSPKITKDGVTVAKAIDLKDPLQNLGAQLVKQVASNTNDKAGDGTTTATILARAMFQRGCKAVDSGINPMDILRGVNLSVEKVVAWLDKIKKQVTTNEEIFNVATISANGDKVIGKLISDAMQKVGKEGTITVSDGKTLNHELELVEGLKLDRGYISPYFVGNSKELKVELERPFILLHSEKISSVQSIIPVLEHVLQNQASLLIVAEDVDSEALATMIVNKLRLGLKICAVKAPGFGDTRREMLFDLASVTGAQVITPESGIKLDNPQQINQVLGRAKSATVSKDSTIIIEGLGDKSAIEERCGVIRTLLNQSNSDYEKEKLQERLAKITGGVAIIKVGGASETEVNEVKDRVQDALCATKAAVEEGTVPGGATALLYATRQLEALKPANYDQKVGIDIVKEAIKAPLKQIVDNAGYEGAVVAGHLLKLEGHTTGFNAQTGEYVDMLAAGILDPTKVVKTALTDAASVASLMTTTEAAIIDVKDAKEENSGGNPGGYMGDMY